jgi:hypothetical protein
MGYLKNSLFGKLLGKTKPVQKFYIGHFVTTEKMF